MAPASRGGGRTDVFDFSELVTHSFVLFSLLWLPKPLITLHPFDLLRSADRLHLLLRF